jgi:hypothetical protein
VRSPLYLLPGVYYVGKKGVDFAFEVVKEWLLKKPGPCEHCRIPINGPTGETVTVVECEIKPHGKK